MLQSKEFDCYHCAIRWFDERKRGHGLKFVGLGYLNNVYVLYFSS